MIACGGGVPLREENVKALRQNGRIIFIKRPLDQLAVEGRPLSVDLPALYERRLPFYEAAADAVLENDSTVAALAEKIAAL